MNEETRKKAELMNNVLLNCW